MEEPINDVLNAGMSDKQIADAIGVKPSEAPCEFCGGAGAVDSGGMSPDGKFIDVPCPTCDGAGHDSEQPEPDTCHECGELAAGVDECGTPFCGACYRRRPVIQDLASRA